MANHSDDPVRHIITFRVNTEEKKALELMAHKSGRSVSNFMRRKLQAIKQDDSVRG